MKTKTKLLAVLAILAIPAGAPAAPADATPVAHDTYVCAMISNNFIVGSKIVTRNGIFVRDASGQYRHIGKNFPFFFGIAFDPRDRNVIYAATLNGCLQSADGGKTWRVSTSWDMTEPRDIAVDPNAPDTIYLPLPDGIAVSTDRGATWQRRENGLPARGKYTQTLAIDRARAGRVLIGCETGIYLTDDAAQNWRRVFATQDTVTDIIQSPLDPRLWLATTQSDGALVSRDNGLAWQKFDGTPSAEALYNIAADSASPLRYAIGSWSYGVLVTEDGGKTWVARNAGLPDGHCVYRVAIDPDNGRLYAAVYEDAIYASDDFGRTWRKDGLEGSTVFHFVFVPKNTAAPAAEK